MTIEEDHDFILLGRLLPISNKTIDCNEYDNVIGDKSRHTTESLLSKGYITEETVYVHGNGRNITKRVFKLTKKGELVYGQLKGKKRNEKVQNGIAWLTLATAIISATYAVLTYYQSAESKNQPRHKEELQQKKSQ